MFETRDELGPFGASHILHAGQMQWEKNVEKNSTIVIIDHQIMWYAISPISVVGVVLNILVLLVWNMNVSHNQQPIIFLFKVLAVFDNMYIISFNIWWYSANVHMLAFVIAGIAFGSQYMLVNTIFLISVWRCIGIFWLEQSRRLLTHFRARLAVAVIVGYCAGLKISERVVAYYVQDKRIIDIMTVVTANSLLSAPLILQSAMMVCLVLTLRRGMEVLPEVSSTGHVYFHMSSRRDLNKVYRLSHTIISRTIFTFIAYPVNGVVGAYFKLSSSVENEYNRKLAIAVIHLLQIVNSCTPFFFYFLFMLKFRRLCLLTFITIYTGTYSPMAPNEAETCTDAPEFPLYRRGSYHPTTVVVGEDATLIITGASRPDREEGAENQCSNDVQDFSLSNNPVVDWANVKVNE